LTDGLQILRYNQSNAYTAHMDYLEDKGKIFAGMMFLIYHGYRSDGFLCTIE
jgi:hypothetical protein